MAAKRSKNREISDMSESRKLRIAVVGATGAVGQEMLRVLGQRDFPIEEVRLLASERSVGQTLQFRGRDEPVRLLEESGFRRVKSAVVPNFRFRSESTQNAAEGFGVKAVMMTAEKPGV